MRLVRFFHGIKFWVQPKRFFVHPFAFRETFERVIYRAQIQSEHPVLRRESTPGLKGQNGGFKQGSALAQVVGCIAFSHESAAQVVKQVWITSLTAHPLKSVVHRGGVLPVSQRDARFFSKIFARQKAHTLNKDNDSKNRQNKPAQYLESIGRPHGLRFSGDSGICQEPKHESEKQHVCWNVKIEIDNRMDQVSADSGERSDLQGHAVAQQLAGKGSTPPSESPEIFPASVKMRT